MRKQFNNADFGPIVSMGPSEFGKAPAFPKPGVHPRLLFTKEMIPNIRRALEDPRYEATAKKLLDKTKIEYDGILGMPLYHASGRKGIHNYDPIGLRIIQAKAFAYAIYGDAELGYQAIDAIQNYLLTLNIRFVFCDQCKEYGSVMQTAYRVYDWCYDLLTEDEKYRLRAGVINYTAIGTSGLLQSDDPIFKNWGGVNKMEMGYPPRGQGCFTGHGSEWQLMVHYMSGAVAFYDEMPDWWEYVAARYFNLYIDARNVYYRSGSMHQGMSYGPYRQICDIGAALIHLPLFGKNVYSDDMPTTIKAYWQHELPDGGFFADGDNWERFSREMAGGLLSEITLAGAALFSDTNLLAQRLYKYPKLADKESAIPDFFIRVSYLVDMIPDEDRHAAYAPVLHNPLYVNKMIARREWNDESSPAVYMKSGHRSAANHEHKDAGSFQIYYKGLLTRDSGVYDVYGSPYSTGTVGHNGVTVFNPAKADTLNGMYSGGQLYIKEAPNLDVWLTDDKKYVVAVREGAAYSIKDGKTEYAYTASNIAPAYDEDVEYLSRRMLSIFPEDKKTPLFFVCFDRITAARASFRKAVLLHSDTEPTVNGNVVTINNGKAKLTATYLSDGEFDIELLGGEDRDRLINGKQIEVSDFRGGGWKRGWGRAEVVPKRGRLTDEVLAVMYAADADSDVSVEVTKLESFGVIGAKFADRAALFIEGMGQHPSIIEIDVPGDGEITYYISGLSAGKWQARIGKKSINLKIKEEERFISFKTEAGRLTLIRK